jgi:hypothetical protein
MELMAPLSPLGEAPKPLPRFEYFQLFVKMKKTTQTLSNYAAGFRSVRLGTVRAQG